jgi:hypothetical protein
MAISGDGNTLAISAQNEDSNAKGINGNQSDNSATGAVYLFTRAGTTWTQPAYVRKNLPDGNKNLGVRRIQQ